MSRYLPKNEFTFIKGDETFTFAIGTKQVHLLYHSKGQVYKKVILENDTGQVNELFFGFKNDFGNPKLQQSLIDDFISIVILNTKHLKERGKIK